jgi:uncharacterized cupredoxin-like copper-binding protein
MKLDPRVLFALFCLIVTACGGNTVSASEPSAVPRAAQASNSPLPPTSTNTPELPTLPKPTVVLKPTKISTAAPATPNAPVAVQITLSEFSIESSLTTFTTGTRYRFVIKNAGVIPHEWAIMPRGEKDDTKALIEVEQAKLPKDASLSREFTFTQAGNLEFACHVPGHWEAGMKLPITVK